MRAVSTGCASAGAAASKAPVATATVNIRVLVCPLIEASPRPPLKIPPGPEGRGPGFFKYVCYDNRTSAPDHEPGRRAGLFDWPSGPVKANRSKRTRKWSIRGQFGEGESVKRRDIRRTAARSTSGGDSVDKIADAAFDFVSRHAVRSEERV